MMLQLAPVGMASGPKLPLLALAAATRAPPACLQLEEDEEFLDDLEFQLRRASGMDPAVPRSPQDLGVEFSRRRFAIEPRELWRRYASYIQRPEQRLLLGTLSLLLGFYVAQGLSPGFVGQGGFWEYAAGFFSVIVVELITKAYYSKVSWRRSATAHLLNAFKVGFVYGCALDALKFAN